MSTHTLSGTVEFVCLSNRPVFHEQMAASIPPTMGNLARWNLTIVDADQYDLFSGYNFGAKQTKGDLLVFVHDDVRFMANSLAMTRPLDSLNNPAVGFIGIAGTRLLERDGCWWGHDKSPQVQENCRGMSMGPTDDEFATEVFTWPSPKGLFGRVVVLDGVLLMCHRRTFERLGGFDEKNFKGHHFYDIEITLRASLAQLANYAAPIPLMHFTTGQVGPEWETNRQAFLAKYGHLLPARIT